MRAGQLQHSITIQHDLGTADAAGEIVSDWQTYATVRASIKPLNGRELIQAKQVQSETTHNIEMYWLDGVTSKMRVLFGSRILEILSTINVDEESRYAQLVCKEIT